MVTSNKQSDKKVVRMAEQNNIPVVPQRTLLGEVNEHITCPLCRGYYIDATTIVECLHSFCRSCIIKHLQVKSYCPVCEMMINSAKPNIKLDKALQDIVYKLVPGLFQKEMERRQQFYASRPGPAASATPEQRGEDTERIIFSPEDVISFSLEYADATDADSTSSKSSDSNEVQLTSLTTRRYLQCPAVVNISHLKKFLSMKFDIDSTQFAIDILYKRVPLPDYYTLMDIAYIYNWKRNEPMRFFYQIIDYVAIRNRLFDINRKGSHFPDRKSSPTCTEETNPGSPTPNINDHVSEASSGTDSPMPDENNVKKIGDTQKKNDFSGQDVKDIKNVILNHEPKCSSPSKKNDDEVEKSQFLNSFELKAKNNSTSSKSSPVKANNNEPLTSPKDICNKNSSQTPKIDESLKRKFDIPKTLPEMKKIKIEIAKVPLNQTSSTGTTKTVNVKDTSLKVAPETSNISQINEESNPSKPGASSNNAPISALIPNKDIKQQQLSMVKQQQQLDSPGQKRTVAVSQTISSPKRKPSDPSIIAQPSPLVQKTVSPLKLQLPKPESHTTTVKQVDTPKTTIKKMPDLKPSIPPPIPSAQNKQPTSGKLRMDLLANNCDPTIDRSKILSQVKTSLPTPNTGQPSGDPLKSLFDSCKINIPSSLSITLTDQKLDPRNSSDTISTDPKKNIVNKNLTSTTSTHKVPSPPVHNYIEILKLPDTDPKKQNKAENITEKSNSQNKIENTPVQPKLPSKTSETSAKGPIPNLKPIADTKLGKQSANYSAPITFQQTFEQQLQSLQSDKKPKVPKNKAQVPKLVPATPKSFSAANKLNNSINKTPTSLPATENKASTALDLSTPHNIQSQLGPQQTKAFETMQSIANLAKKQNMHPKILPLAMSQANVFPNMSNRSLAAGPQTLRVPSTSTLNQLKLDKLNPGGSQMNSPRQETTQRNPIKHTTNASATVPLPSFTNNSPNNTQPSPRSQTRSPSSSPKLVIAEEKQASSLTSEHNINQSNQITSTQLSNANIGKTESPKASPGPSKTGMKPVKPMMPAGKVTGIRQPITPTVSSNPPINNPADFLSKPQLMSHAHQAILRHQMEMQNAWLNAQRQYDLFKNMSNMAHQTQNDFNNKDKQ